MGVVDVLVRLYVVSRPISADVFVQSCDVQSDVRVSIPFSLKHKASGAYVVLDRSNPHAPKLKLSVGDESDKSRCVSCASSSHDAIVTTDPHRTTD